MTKQEWLKKNGFNENEATWCICGEDTYFIKEQLKEMGCKFSPLLKWHSPIPFNLPEGYKMFPVYLVAIGEWNDEKEEFCYLEKAKEYVERKFKEAEGPSLSEYIGEIGERLYNITAVYKSTRGFSNQFGWTYIHTFQTDDNVLVWFTAKDLDLERGQAVDLTGTIKRHEEFRNVKTTHLSRCIVKPI